MSICLFIHLSIYLSICLSVCLSVFLSIFLSIYLPIYLSTYLSTYLPIYLPTYLPTYLSIYLAFYLFVYLSICLSIHVFFHLPVCLLRCFSIHLSVDLSVFPSFYLLCLLCCACLARCIFAEPLQMSHGCHGFWICYKTLTLCSLLTRCTVPCACHAKQHLNVQKWSEHVFFFNIFISKYASRHNGAHFFDISTAKSALELKCCAHSYFQKCASRHNGVHFFDISTSKSVPKPRRFVHFDFEMCFVPQQRAIFISHLASWLRTRRFSEPTLRPPRATNHWKNKCFASFLTSIFFLLTLSLL